MLLLNYLTAAEMPEVAREVGLTREATERTLQTATSKYALHRDSASTQINAELAGLASVTSGSPFPRASIIRRAGAVRRRAFTSLGIGVAVASLVGSGLFVTDETGVSPKLPDEELVGTVDEPGPEPARLEEAELLTPEQATRLEPTRTWQEARTTPNTSGSGLYSACQESRFADPDGAQALVRTFRSDTPQRRSSRAGRPGHRAVAQPSQRQGGLRHDARLVRRLRGTAHSARRDVRRAGRRRPGLGISAADLR